MVQNCMQQKQVHDVAHLIPGLHHVSSDHSKQHRVSPSQFQGWHQSILKVASWIQSVPLIAFVHLITSRTYCDRMNLEQTLETVAHGFVPQGTAVACFRTYHPWDTALKQCEASPKGILLWIMSEFTSAFSSRAGSCRWWHADNSSSGCSTPAVERPTSGWRQQDDSWVWNSTAKLNEDLWRRNEKPEFWCALSINDYNI